MKTWIKTGLTLGTFLALITLILAVASCRSGDNFMWDDWAGSAYLAEAGDITIDPDPLVVNTISHIVMTFDVTDYTDLVSKESFLDPVARTLTVVVYARERDNQTGTWDGTLTIAVTFPDSGLWYVVVPQEGGREAGIILDVHPPEGAPEPDVWAGDPYYPNVSNVTVDPDPLVAFDFSHITLNFLATEATDLISLRSAVDTATQTLTVEALAQEHDNQPGDWDGIVTVPVTFLDSGVWQLIIVQEDDAATTIDLFVEAPAGAPDEDVWAGDPYYPDVGDVTTDPDTLMVNDFVRITLNFLTTPSTDLISQSSSVDAIARTVTVEVFAREHDNQAGTWDGTVTVPVTFLESGVWQLVVPQDDGTATIDLYVAPLPGAPSDDIWVGDEYLPDAGDITTSPDPVQVNKLSHVTVNYNISDYTELINQESALDPVARTLTVTATARERGDQTGSWDGKIVVPVTFLERGVWHIIVPQEGGSQVTLDIYVYPQEDMWDGDAYMPIAGDITIDPDPVTVNDLAHVTVNFNTTDYTELTSQEWVVDGVANTLTITVYARERADRDASWGGTVTVPVTFLTGGAWQIIVPQEGGGVATADLWVEPLP